MKSLSNIKSYLKSKPIIELLHIFFAEIVPGYRIYMRIIDLVDKDTKILICSPRGTGDIYIIGRYFKYYLLENDIKKYEFIFRGESERKVGKLFGICGSIILNDHEVWLLNRFKQYVGENNTRIIELHHYAYPEQSHVKSIYFEGYNGWTFEELIKRVGMGITEKVNPYLPRFQTENNIESIFKKRGLIPGKTVIISPFSSSAYVLDCIWWTELVKKLKKIGYTVATNVATESDYAIMGTIRLSIPYEKLKSYVEYAGYFIGARSGLCDILSDCSCYKIVLTPYWNKDLPWQGCPGKTLDFYRVENNVNCKDCFEIEYNNASKNNVQDCIIDTLTTEKRIHGIMSFPRENEVVPCVYSKTAIVYYISNDNFLKVIVSLASLKYNIMCDYDILVFVDEIEEWKIECILGMDKRIRIYQSEEIVKTATYGIEKIHDERNILVAVLPFHLKNHSNIIFVSENMIFDKFIDEVGSDKEYDWKVRVSEDVSYRAYMNSKYRKIENDERYKLELLKKNHYPNVDLIQIDVQEYISTIDEKRAVKLLINKYKNDLSAFYLGVFENDISYLSQKYNLIPSIDDVQIFFCRYLDDYELYTDYCEACKTPFIVNYKNLSTILGMKPSIWSEIYWKYAKMTPCYELILKCFS